MRRIFQYAAEAAVRAARFGLVATALFSLSLSARAGSVWDAVEAGHITWSQSGTTTNWVDGELVIKFTDTKAPLSLHLPGYARARALAIGGGGSGAAGSTATSKFSGGGGGGGAGGFVEANSLLLVGGEGALGDYVITVGAGGASKPNDTRAQGNSGFNSSLTYGGVALDDFPVAKGGGGGGAQKVGLDGGSGGGGSLKRESNYEGTANDGGATTQAAPGVGNKGGRGSVQWVGGGGGGAGEPGAESIESGAKGGDGKASDITGELVVYAGGGGGGLNTAKDGYAAGAGGAGGGGRGGDGTTAAVSGTDGLGGGGGGSSVAGVAGKGGDGVVIIRIFWIQDGPIEKPQSVELDYNGKLQSGGVAIPGLYTLTGDYEAKDVNTYKYTAHLEPGLHWGDDPTDTDPVEVEWSIRPGRIAKPTPPEDALIYNDLVYTVAEETDLLGFTTNPDTTPSVIKARDAGTYTYTAYLKDATNYRWEDDGSITNVTYSWTIAPLPVTRPEPAVTNVVYDEKNHTAAKTNTRYQYVQNPDGSESVIASSQAGTYQYTAQLIDKHNTCWDDGSTDDKTYTWKILPRKIEFPPLPTNLVYAGTNAVAVLPNDHYYTFGKESVTNATDAGVYSIIFKLTDPANNTWPDGTTADATKTWEIARKPISQPPTPEPFVYDGAYKTAVEPSPYWERKGTYSAMEAGDYTATVALKKNWCWNTPFGPSTLDLPIDWQILQAPNEITSLKIGDWKLGEQPKKPSITAKFGAATVQYTYGKSEAGPWEATVPNTNGTFYVRAVIPETTDWSGAVRTKKFLIYKGFDELFRAHTLLDFSAYHGEPITDARILIEISETAFPGFRYEDCPDGDGLAFMNLTEGTVAPLSYDVDTWNTNGTSYVWLKIPRLETREGYAQTQVDMYWYLRPGMSGPGPDAEEVWSGYEGVWHFSEEIKSDISAETPSADATGHGYDAVPTGSLLTSMTSADGAIGRSRRNASSSSSKGTSYFTISNFVNSALGTNFVFEGWVKFTSLGSYVTWLLSRNDESTTNGFAMAAAPQTPPGRLNLYGNTPTAKQATFASGQTLVNHWVSLTWIVSGRDYTLAVRSPDWGESHFSGQLAASVSDALNPLAFGSDTSGAKPSAQAYFDEFRLRKWDPATETRASISNAAATVYQNTTAPGAFVGHDWIVIDGTNQNYWVKEPKLTKYVWESDGSDGWGSVIDGEPAVGTVNYVVKNLFSGHEVATNSLPVTEPGHYSITFTVEEEGFSSLVTTYNYIVNGHKPEPYVGATEEGRILLANDDSCGDWGESSVTNQAYWRLRQIDKNCTSNWTELVWNGTRWVTKTFTTNWVETSYYSPFWTHFGDSTYNPTLRPFVLTNSCHTLETTNSIPSLCDGKVLWRLDHIMIGNLWIKDFKNYDTRNYLPWSETSCAISSNGAAFAQSEVGHLIMRNTLDAQIRSGCYTNGIGTIYFDAVNSQKHYNAADPYGKDFRLTVEIATEVVDKEGRVLDANGNVWDEKGDVPKMIPTDENVYEVIKNDDGSKITNFTGHANWKTVDYFGATMNGIVHEGTTISTPKRTDYIELNHQLGGDTKNFTRVYIPLNIYEPARFRIKRVSVCGTQPIDGNAYILLDNLIVSKPQKRADMTSLGRMDFDKRGPHVLGMEGATTVPYPAITDTDIYGRARPIFQTAGDTGADTNDFISAVKMHYRWRYLNQTAGLETATNWTGQTVDMVMRDGLVVASEPIVHPGAEGDVEYWFETFLHAPFYDYVDYSGSDYYLKGANGKPLYTEELATICNHFFERPEYAEWEPVGLPSLGRDWFFRLRNGRDLHGSATLWITDGPEALCGPHPMYLSEDNNWRCLLALPKVEEEDDDYDDEDEPKPAEICKFYFTLNDEQEPGAVEFVENEVSYSPTEELKAIPAKGPVSPGQNTKAFTVDHAATHLEWRLNDKFLTFAVTRAEYQHFNNWSDAHKDLFSANWSETNGVNVVDMKSYSAKMGTWPLYQPGDEEWNENFYLADEHDIDFPKDEIFQVHATPSGWGGNYLAFVAEKLGTEMQPKPDSDEYWPYPNDAGTAGKLIGQNKGKISFTFNNRPDGLEEISFKARVGQSIEWDSFSFSEAYVLRQQKNYTFTTLATMSNMTGDDKALVDSAAASTISLIAYRTGNGCYEFRIERVQGGQWLMLSIWKWSTDASGAFGAKCLVKRRMSAKLWTNSGATLSDDPFTASKKNPDLYLLFISAVSTPDPTTGRTLSTTVTAGLSKGAQVPYKSDGGFGGKETDFSQMMTGYAGVSYTDTASPLAYGTWGVAAKDCPVVFLRPAHREGGVVITGKNGTVTPVHTAGDNNYIVGMKDLNAKHFDVTVWYDDGKPPQPHPYVLNLAPGQLTSDWDDIAGDADGSWWSLAPNRIESFNTPLSKGSTSVDHRGLMMPTNLEQKVYVMLAPKESPNLWETIATNVVKGYGFTDYSIPLYRKGQYNMMFTTGEKAIDVVVDDIVQKQWMAKDISGLDDIREDFVYTQGHVVTNEPSKRTEIELVPARAHAEHAVSVRSPVVKGLGKIAFDYSNVDADAEIWVQVATNSVNLSNLGGESGYNWSTNEVPYGQDQAIGTWLTVKKYSAKAPAGTDEYLKPGGGQKSVYIGLHNHKGRPITGVFRLYVPAEKVLATDAMTRDELVAGGRDFGKITVSNVTVTDEPGLDDRSWRGWNMRTVGDSADSEKRMYLCDTTLEDGTGNGLVCALNNSINDVDTSAPGFDEDKLKTGNPAIWSPTLGTYLNEFGEKVQAGVGEVTFKARLYMDEKHATVKGKPAKIAIWGADNSVLGRWTKVATVEVDKPYFQNYTWKAGADSYAALRFEVDDDSARTTNPKQDCVIIDEITITERVQPTLSFLYAWPFRDGLNGDEPIANVGRPEQQPLAGENWGFQTKLALQQLADEVDLSRGLEVSLAYFTEKPTAANWGYLQWQDHPTGEVRLQQVGDASNLVFRSTANVPASVLPPSPDPNTVVQFMVKVRYYDKGGMPYDDRMKSWSVPKWYHPVDYNKTLGNGQSNAFAGFTILDTISPGRAWINEVNWNNGRKSVTGTDSLVDNNQFIEICIPSGVSMKDWTLRLYDMDGKYDKYGKENGWTMARFGSTKIPASKVSGQAKNGYEFFVIESPKTNKDHGLKDADGNPVIADGVWNDDGGAGARGGTLNYAEPFGFELVRPSGVIEHTFTLGGTNELPKNVWYDPGHLCEEMNGEDGSPNRFYAGRELEKNENGAVGRRNTTFGSSGVVGEKTVVAPSQDEKASPFRGPGSADTWKHGLDFTPGAINQGQTIPEGWFLAPNGTNSWVYFSVIGSHLVQKLGGPTNRMELVILPQGATTNITYLIDPWWEIESIKVNGTTVAQHEKGVRKGEKREKQFEFKAPEDGQTTVNVIATEGVDSTLDQDRYGLKGQRYANAVVRWLQENWPERNPEEIRFARYGGLTGPAETPMTLIDMYWLDICPFNGEGSPFESEDPARSEWAFRGGWTYTGFNAVYRERSWGLLTNSLFKVKMMVTNEWTNLAYAPYTLQGLNNESSALGNYIGGWTSVSFKVCGFLDVNPGFNKGALPFREFVFNEGSFAPKGAVETWEGGLPKTPGEFEAIIELLDPFSKGSIGYEYGWWRHPEAKESSFWTWTINSTNLTPVTVETLKADSSYNY